MFMSLRGSKEAFLVIFVIGKKVCEHSAISIDRNSHGRLHKANHIKELE